jgi:endonuclease/exonuclease/phosphatase family metal-dependent hydrolase
MMQTPHRDIDYVSKFGIHVMNISTLGINYPVISDHLGIILDLDLASYFSSDYSDIANFLTVY